MSSTLTTLHDAAVAHALGRCPLFAGLTAAELRPVVEITTAKALSKGEYLFHEGDPVRGFYVVQTGAINVHRVNAAGKEQVIGIFRAGESFAEAALTSAKGYPANARSVGTARLLLVQKTAFWRCCGASRNLASACSAQ